MSGMDKAATLVNLIDGCIYKYRSRFSLHTACGRGRTETGMETQRKMCDTSPCKGARTACVAGVAKWPWDAWMLAPSRCLSWVAAVQDQN